jgi:hypothetical protein
LHTAADGSLLLAIVGMHYVTTHLTLVKVINRIFIFSLEHVVSLAPALAAGIGFHTVFFLFHQGPLLVFF